MSDVGAPTLSLDAPSGVRLITRRLSTDIMTSDIRLGVSSQRSFALRESAVNEATISPACYTDASYSSTPSLKSHDVMSVHRRRVIRLRRRRAPRLRVRAPIEKSTVRRGSE